jgi:molybdenum cofactor synthesis domain-containing protein
MHLATKKGPSGHIDPKIALERFQSRIKGSNARLKTEFVELLDAHGRVLARDIVAQTNVPPFHKAGMDGYAIRSADTAAARPDNPITLSVVGKAAAGDSQPKYRLRQGEALAIATGAALPRGSDAVEMIEHTRLRLGGKIEIRDKVGRGQHVSLIGEDLKKGNIVLKKGTWITSQDVGMIATAGFDKVPVFQKPKVAVLATGNELVEPGRKLRASSIFESNRYMISCLIKECGGEPVDLGICRDEKDSIASSLRKASQFDLVVVCGGTSVGSTDFVPELVKEMGQLIVHGVAMKPGSPTGLGTIKGKPVILTPGFPVSAFVAFYTFGRPILLSMLQTKGQPTNEAVFSATMIKPADNLNNNMRSFVRVKISRTDGKYLAEPISAAGARLISTLVGADGMVVVDGRSHLRKGEGVQVIPFRSVLVDNSATMRTVRRGRQRRR